MKTKVFEMSKLGGALEMAKREHKMKRKMHISIHSHEDYPDSTEFNKRELSRLQEEINHYSNALKNFDSEDAASKVKAAMESELSLAKANLAAAKARHKTRQ